MIKRENNIIDNLNKKWGWPDFVFDYSHICDDLSRLWISTPFAIFSTYFNFNFNFLLFGPLTDLTYIAQAVWESGLIQTVKNYVLNQPYQIAHRISPIDPTHIDISIYNSGWATYFDNITWLTYICITRYIEHVQAPAQHRLFFCF